jgi:hypothetical protein
VTFHIMRDNPAHGTNIMGGMFGVRQGHPESKGVRKSEFDRMLEEYGKGWFKGQDQVKISEETYYDCQLTIIIRDACTINILNERK